MRMVYPKNQLKMSFFSVSLSQIRVEEKTVIQYHISSLQMEFAGAVAGNPLPAAVDGGDVTGDGGS